MTTAWVFPGQGSQLVGMGRDLYAHVPAARAVFDQADALLGFSLSTLCFAGPEERLTATENTQPALLTTCVALLAAHRRGVLEEQPACVAGHSLGEYTALVAAGGLAFEAALPLVRRRGELMAAATAGSMAAILGLEEVALEQLCREVSEQTGAILVVANYNSPGQLVISGTTAAVTQALGLAKERGARRALPLKVSAAFHSPLMSVAAQGMAVAVAAAPVTTLHAPLIANASAQPLTDSEAVRRELVEQITAPVRWTACVQHMLQAGVDTFVEIGPGNVLTGLIKRIAPSAKLVNISGAC